MRFEVYQLFRKTHSVCVTRNPLTRRRFSGRIADMVMKYPRLLRVPSSSFFLLGVRGVGKSTWVKGALPKALRIDLLDEALYQELLANPALFRALIQDRRPRDWVVIDEVQRIPSLLNEVHRAIEELKVRFALLGSSARKLRRAGVNLLGGRAVRLQMNPLMPEELGKDFNLEKVLQLGTIPLVWSAPNPAKQLEAYVQMYLKEEIQAEALVRNLPGFLRFLPIAALFHAQVLNIDGLARDAGVARTTVQGYIEILEDTLLAFRLPAFEGRLRVKERRHPKLYWIDPGLVRAAKKQFGKVSIEERGALFEGWVITLLRAERDAGRLEFDEMFYWASGGTGPEVDIILQRGSELIAIEVKASDRLRDNFADGLRAIVDLPGVKRRIVVYLGARSARIDTTIEVLPLAQFLKGLNKLF
jgi:predicted AAA+ superfamily ATPase